MDDSSPSSHSDKTVPEEEIDASPKSRPASGDYSPCVQLYSSVFEGHESEAKRLLDEGVDASWAQDNGDTILGAAAQNGHLKIAQLLLQHGANPSGENNAGWSVLHAAVSRDHWAIVILLLDHGANVSAATNMDQTALHFAAYLGHSASAAALLDRNAEISAVDSMKRTPLHVAVQEGHDHVVEMLLNRGADPSAISNQGIAPLHLAAWLGRESAITLLLDRGADRLASTQFGYTALHCAAEAGHVESVMVLVQRSVPILTQNTTRHTALHLAFKPGHSAVIDTLLSSAVETASEDRSAGCSDEDVEAAQELRANYLSMATNNGKTALHLALQEGHTSAVKLLIEYGANPAAKDNQGQSPVDIAFVRHDLDVMETFLANRTEQDPAQPAWDEIFRSAAFSGDTSTITLLIKHGINVSGKDERGWSALLKAAAVGNVEMVKLLISHGAEVSSVAQAGWTPLIAAAEGGHLEVVRLLLRHGARASEKRTNNWSALYTAATAGHEAVVQLLLEHGADAYAAADDGGTALMAVVEEGHEVVVKTLLDHRINDAAASSGGSICLYKAAARDNETIMRMLLDQNFKHLASVNDGLLPLHIAANGGHEKVVQVILEREPSSIDERARGMTPLHIAAQKGHEAVCRVLLENGADSSAVTDFGRTAADWAKEAGHVEIEKMIREHRLKLADSDLEITLRSRAEVSSYEYCKLSNASTHTRLIYLDPEGSDKTIISGSLRAAALDEEPQYVAMSYTWGEPIFDHSLVLDGHLVFITRNLYSALRRFRNTSNRVFWVDQICINQVDEAEVSQQVSNMSRIYSLASSVWIWLGEDDTNIMKEALNLARMVIEAEPDAEGDEIEQIRNSKQIWSYKEPGKSRKETWWPLVTLYSKRWFSRLWVVQEFVLARDYRLFCGDYEIPQKLFLRCFTAFAEPSSVINQVQSIQFKQLFSSAETPSAVGNLSEMLMLRRLHHSTSIDGIGLDTLLLWGLLHSIDFRCANPRDKIYSLYGLMPDDPCRPMPDYSLSVEEVYTDFARYYVRAGFGARLIAAASLSKPRLGLPSWCPDWSRTGKNNERTNFCSSVPDLLEERVVLHQNTLRIVADGCLLDVITDLGPPFESGRVVDMYTDYRAWYRASEPLLNSAVTSRYGEDGDALLLWCRLITGGSIKSFGDVPVSQFLGFHNAIWDEQGLHEAMGEAMEHLRITKGLSDISGADNGSSPEPYTESSAVEVESSSGKEIEKSATVQEGDSILEENNGEETPRMVVPDLASWSFLLSFSGKRLCVTARGYPGMLNPDIQAGDIVSVIYGTTFLTVLRAVGETFRIVGTASLLDLSTDDVQEIIKTNSSEIVLC